jgi:hypothetical protein
VWHHSRHLLVLLHHERGCLSFVQKREGAYLIVCLHDVHMSSIIYRWCLQFSRNVISLAKTHGYDFYEHVIFV